MGLKGIFTNLLIELDMIRTQLTEDISGFFCHGVQKQVNSRQAAISNWVTLKSETIIIMNTKKH